MAIESQEPGIEFAVEESYSGLNWPRLVVVSGVVATTAIASAAIYLRDIEGGVVAVVFGVSTWLFWSGRRRTGAVGLFVVAAITSYFMTTAALVNVRGFAGIEGMVIAGGLSGVSALVLMSIVGWVIRKDATAMFGPWVVIGVFVLSVAQPLLTGFPPTESAGSADIDLVADNVGFSHTDLRALAGQVTVSLENKDLFWHTFTVEELGVDLRVPVSARMTVVFDAPPGEYRFFCDIPGHPEAGMEGTLVVEG